MDVHRVVVDRQSRTTNWREVLVKGWLVNVNTAMQVEEEGANAAHNDY